MTKLVRENEGDIGSRAVSQLDDVKQTSSLHITDDYAFHPLL